MESHCIDFFIMKQNKQCNKLDLSNNNNNNKIFIMIKESIYTNFLIWILIIAVDVSTDN